MKRHKAFDILAAPVKHIIRGRIEETPGPYRSEFGRDRDRILYSKEFRRLAGKTQVFLSRAHDHLRTRLTHTLEVAQIAMTTCSNLGLDLPLTEAIAFAHDVGHTPFGHAGEKTLSFIMESCDPLADFQQCMGPSEKGFKHNLQGIRVVSDLERLYGKAGLNLTNFTLWGILNHTSRQWSACPHLDESSKTCYLKRDAKRCSGVNGRVTAFYDRYWKDMTISDPDIQAWSFEAEVVKYADEIAQRHHDVEDSILMEVLSIRDLIDELKERFSVHCKENKPKLKHLLQEMPRCGDDRHTFLGYVSKFLVELYNGNLIRNSKDNLRAFVRENHIQSSVDFERFHGEQNDAEIASVVGFDKEFEVADKSFQDFLKNRVLNSFEVQRMDGKGRFIIRRLFKAYLTNPRQLHDSTILYAIGLHENRKLTIGGVSKKEIGKYRNEIDSPGFKSNSNFRICLLRAICDHIAGMTDAFALSEFQKLYGDTPLLK